MKTILTIQESAELIKRGVSINKASVKCPIDAPYRTSGIYIASVFTLADLLSLLPKVIWYGGRVPFTLDIYADEDGWQMTYTSPHSRNKEGWNYAEELIDALFTLLLWAIDHNHVKLD